MPFYLLHSIHFLALTFFIRIKLNIFKIRLVAKPIQDTNSNFDSLTINQSILINNNNNSNNNNKEIEYHNFKIEPS